MHACGHDTHTAMLVACGAAAVGTPRRSGRARAVHVPARRGGSPRRRASCWRKACSTSRRSPTARPRRSTRAFALHITSALPTGWMSCRGGAIDGLRRHAATSPSPGVAATPASRIGRSIRSRWPARWCRRCRRWSRGPSTCSTQRCHRWSHHGGHDEQRHPRDGRDRGHDPRRQRDTRSQARPRRRPARRRRHRRGPRVLGRRSRSRPATRSR